MASLEARRLDEAHRLAQARLARRTVVQAFTAWHLVDAARLDATAPEWLAVLVPLVQVSRRMSADLAAGYLAARRALDIGVDGFQPVAVAQVPAEKIITSLLVTGPISVKRAMVRSVPLRTAMKTAQVASSRAAMRHVVDGGRETVRETVAVDPRGRGWTRVLSAKPCPFCQSLAVEGDAFTSHDGCHCSAAPAYQ